MPKPRNMDKLRQTIEKLSPEEKKMVMEWAKPDPHLDELMKKAEAAQTAVEDYKKNKLKAPVKK